jgi:hypothetical protein
MFKVLGISQPHLDELPALSDQKETPGSSSS